MSCTVYVRMNLQFRHTKTNLRFSFSIKNRAQAGASLGRDGAALPAPARAVWLRVRVNVREIHAFFFAVNKECGAACNVRKRTTSRRQRFE